MVTMFVTLIDGFPRIYFFTNFHFLNIFFSAIQWGFKKSPFPWRLAWSLAALVEEVQDISTQSGASFSHIPHQANDMADGLAREGVLWLIISFDV